MVVKSDEPMSWADRVTWLVKEFHGGNASTAGRLWGMSPQGVAKLAAGDSEPKGETLAAILRCHPTINPEWLLLGVGEPERPAPVPELDARRALEDAYRIISEARAGYSGSVSLGHSEGQDAQAQREADLESSEPWATDSESPATLPDDPLPYEKPRNDGP